MADTIVNTTPAPQVEDSGGNGVAFLVGAVILVLLAFFAFYYALPMLRSATQGPSVNVEVPRQVDVNVNNPQN